MFNQTKNNHTGRACWFYSHFKKFFPFLHFPLLLPNKVVETRIHSTFSLQNQLTGLTVMAVKVAVCENL